MLLGKKIAVCEIPEDSYLYSLFILRIVRNPWGKMQSYWMLMRLVWQWKIKITFMDELKANYIV
jgi:hypothetical protein